MLIRVKLMGLLKENTPPGDKIEVPDRATIEDVLCLLDISTAHIHLVMINGQQEHDHHHCLTANDELMVIPPVAGG